LILAKTFDIGFGLLCCLIGVFAELGNASLLTLRLNINDKTRLIGGANDPPVCQDQSRERDSSGAE
jgi:hypothetical protein